MGIIVSSNTRGYILIEIIVSVMLLSFAGIALLNVNSNQKKIYLVASKKLEFSKYISIFSNRHSIDFHNKEKNLYELVKQTYNLKNQELIKILKNRKLKYSQKYKSVINIGSKDSKNKINILIDEIKISDKKATSTYLTIKL